MKKSEIPQNWQKVNDKIQRNFEFDTFERSIEFVNGVAQIAKRQNHHPQIKIDYNEVTLTIWTHEREAITDKDIEFALSADSAYETSK